MGKDKDRKHKKKEEKKEKKKEKRRRQEAELAARERELLRAVEPVPPVPPAPIEVPPAGIEDAVLLERPRPTRARRRAPAVAPATRPAAPASPRPPRRRAALPPAPAPDLAPAALPPVPPAEPAAFETTGEHDSPESIEARMDRMLRQSIDPDAARHAHRAGAERLVERLGGEPAPAPEQSVLESARELLSSDYYLRVWGQLGMRRRSLEIDEYGLDPKVEQRWQPFFDFLYATYWRVRARGLQHVPDAGRCLLVANHSGTVPYDGAMIKTAVRREHPARRSVRWLAEDFVFHFPFLGAFMNRIGAVRACPENAERMLRQDRLVAVFPEGIKGIGKLWRERYQLQRFGRGGYIKLVLRTGAPIVPVAVVGAEEIHPLLFKGQTLAQLVGMPYIPVTPTFPWLGPLGLVPLPSRWLIEFGEPITFDGHGPADAEDAILVNRLNEQVRSKIQAMVEALLAERKAAEAKRPAGSDATL